MESSGPSRRNKTQSSHSFPPPRQTAKVTELAETQPRALSGDGIDAVILERIKKCLDRANHPNAAEMEAKAALRMSSRLMAQYNVSQADLLAQATTSEEQANLGGESTVGITTTRPSGKPVMQTWVGDVASACTTFFDCKSYSAAGSQRIDWTFYGISQNTAAAATAFEMVHNLVLEWARAKRGSINSYCLGAGMGLREMANKEKRNEERLARKSEAEKMAARVEEERRERQKELDRLNGHIYGEENYARAANVEEDIATPECVPEHPDSPEAFDFSSELFSGADVEGFDSDDENEMEPTFKQENEPPLDLTADFEDELQKIVKQERSLSPHPGNFSRSDSLVPKAEFKTEAEDFKIKIEQMDDEQPAGELSVWTSTQQIILFRETAMNVAEEYLKSTNLKLGTARKRTYSVRDPSAFEEGKKDSGNIDVRRRRLE